MENQHISDEIGSGYISENTWNTQDQLKGIGNSGVDSLKELVTEIQTLIKGREKLSEDFIKEGEKMKRDINNFLLENAPKSTDYSEFAKERSELRKKLIDVSELQLNEKVGCWRDIALLKKELRDREKELNEKTSRSEMLRGILEE